jgi:hypothetical protein
MTLDRAFIHIGFEKTGSTSLFNSLAASRAELAAHGVLFTDIPEVHQTLPLAFGAVTEDRLARLATAAGGDAMATAKAALAALDDAVARFDGDTLVLSSQMFAGLPRDALARMADHVGRLARTVRIVAYVRHPVGVAVSLSQQLVKTGKFTRVEAERNPRIWPFAPRLSKHVAVFGRSGVLVRPFDPRALVDGKVQNDFLTLIGYPGPLAAVSNVDSNQSLSMPALVFKDLANQAAGKARVPTFQSLFGVAGGRFALPAEALADAARKGAADVEYVASTFGLDLRPPSAEPRGEMASYFDDGVVAALERVCVEHPRREAVRNAIFAALSAIRAGAYDAPRREDLEAGRRIAARPRSSVTAG